MAGEETLHVIVYDEALVDAIGKLDSARRLSPIISKTKGEAVVLKGIVESRSIKEFIRDIPRISRASRLLLTQVPGAREALTATYRGKMLAGADPAIAVAVISLYVVQQIKQMWETIKQERISYENMLQAGLDLNYTELSRLTKLQTGYATWWDQFQTAVETEGFINAVRDIVIGAFPSLLQREVGDIGTGLAGIGPHPEQWGLGYLYDYLFGRAAPNGRDVIRGDSVPGE